MSQSITSWLNRPDIARLKKMSEDGNMRDLFGKDFFRDPMRNIYHLPDTFYSPADGIVLYVHNKVDPVKDKVLDVKGIQLTLQDLLNDKDYKEPSLVIGIFMTYLDVHINRAPIDSYFTEERATPFLYTHNISMSLLESQLLRELRYNPVNAKYLFHNERRVLTFRSEKTGGPYYIVQVADREVDVILNWDQGTFVRQGERFGIVRWGSQVDLIIPINGKAKLKPLVMPLDHIEGGLDAVVRVL